MLMPYWRDTLEIAAVCALVLAGVTAVAFSAGVLVGAAGALRLADPVEDVTSACIAVNRSPGVPNE